MNNGRVAGYVRPESVSGIIANPSGPGCLVMIPGAAVASLDSAEDLAVQMFGGRDE